MDIAIPLYDRFSALDAIGPYDVLSRLPEARVTFLAHDPGPVTTDNGMLSMNAEKALGRRPGLRGRAPAHISIPQAVWRQ